MRHFVLNLRKSYFELKVFDVDDNSIDASDSLTWEVVFFSKYVSADF